MIAEPMLEAIEIRKSFGALEVIKGVSLKVAKGEVVCIIGPPAPASRPSCAA